MAHTLGLFYVRNFIMQNPNKLSQAVTILASIIKVADSNLGRDEFWLIHSIRAI
jgi:hypothetical protein